jgi:NAD-dependent dihydropyrimidine dehydrogenase PreA subunit
MKIKRKIIRIDDEKCNGCGLCVPSCAEGAIRIIDGKARLVAEKYCDGLGACLGECPENALSVIEAEAETFDADAAGKHVESQRSQKPEPIPAGPSLPCGCPSTLMQIFPPPAACRQANEPVSRTGPATALGHWPVQIRLVPPTAPFLKDADLLVAADCTPVACGRFHQDFLPGRAVLMGCPKFDDAQAYAERFADIFRSNDIRSVAVLVMEVPCCQGLPAIVRKGLSLSGKDVPLDVKIITTRGEIRS